MSQHLPSGNGLTPVAGFGDTHAASSSNNGRVRQGPGWPDSSGVESHGVDDDVRYFSDPKLATGSVTKPATVPTTASSPLVTAAPAKPPYASPMTPTFTAPTTKIATAPPLPPRP